MIAHTCRIVNGFAILYRRNLSLCAVLLEVYMSLCRMQKLLGLVRRLKKDAYERFSVKGTVVSVSFQRKCGFVD